VREVVLAWLGAFAFTQAVEIPIWVHALRKYRIVARGQEPWSVGVAAAIAFGATAVTHPIVWFVFPRYASTTYWVMVLEAETFAVLAEAAYAAFFNLRWPIAWALAANAASAGLGLLSRTLFGWP
jgi:hypothetical protein